MANFNYNCIQLGGRLTGEPEKRTAQNGDPVAQVNIAINRRSKNNEADFFRIVAFRATADFLCAYFHKGSSIFVRGRIQNNNYTDKDGVKRYGNDVIAEDIQFVDSKAEAQPQGQPTAAVGAYQPLPEGVDMQTVDDALPF